MLHYLDMVCFTIQVVPGETTSLLNATLSGHGVFYYASSTWWNHFNATLSGHGVFYYVVPGETTSPLNATLSGHGVFYYASSTWWNHFTT